MADRTHAEYQASEVLWYGQHGHYHRERVVTDGNGQPYVIGDQHWNRGQRPREWIERDMRIAIMEEQP